MIDEKLRAEELMGALEELTDRYKMLCAIGAPQADIEAVVAEFTAAEAEFDDIVSRVEKRHGLPPIEAH